MVFVGPPAVELILSLPTEPHGKNNRGGFWPPQVWLGQILQLNFPSFPFGVGLGGLVVVGGKWGKSQFSRELLWDNERQAVASLGTNWKHKLDKSGFLFQPKLKTKDHPQAMGFLFWFKIKPNVIFDILELAAFRKYSTDSVLQKFEEPCRIYKKYVNLNDMMI